MKKGYLLSGIVLSLFLLTSCSAYSIFGPTITPTTTPTNTNTPTPTATSTPTATPTPNPATLADQLGLESSRTYVLEEIEGTQFLVDTYNTARKAIKENGVWRMLDYTNLADAEIMYGHLVENHPVLQTTATEQLEGGGFIYASKNYYIKTTESWWNNSPQITFRTINPVYLGDWFYREMKYKDKMVKVVILLMGIRNNVGDLRVVEFAFDSPDVDPGHLNSMNCRSGNTFGGTARSIDDFLDYVIPGTKFEIGLPKAKTGSSIPDSSWDGDPIYAMLRWFTNNYPENQLSAKEYSQMIKTSEWPDRVVIVYDLTALYYGPDGCGFN